MRPDGVVAGRIQIGITIEPDQIEVFVVASRTGQQTDRLRAISGEHQNQRAALHRGFSVNFQIVEPGNDRGKISRAAMFIVVRKQTLRAIAVIREPRIRQL